MIPQVSNEVGKEFFERDINMRANPYVNLMRPGQSHPESVLGRADYPAALLTRQRFGMNASSITDCRHSAPQRIRPTRFADFLHRRPT